jgi:3-phosphoglycerate kinase
LRLPRDHYVRLDSNDYSVHPGAVGRRVLVRADLDRVQAFCDGQQVADHARIWATHQTISDPAHVEAAKVLRRSRIHVDRPPTESEVPIRDLSSYDTAFGVDLDGGAA